LKIFWAFARQAFQFIAAYRFNFFMEFVLVLLRMYGIYWVWRVLYTQRPGAFGVDLGQMVTYGVMGMAIELFIWSRPQWYMANQVKSGAIDTDLMKPMDFHFYMLARSVGELLIGIGVLGLPALLVAYLFLDIQPPPDLLNGLMFVGSLVLGFLLLFHLNFLLGSLSVVALDIRHISWAYFSMVRFLGGQIVPLWLFPDFLRVISEGLPFKGTYYIPISIYIGQLSGVEALRAIEFQLVWLVVLVLLSRVLWGWAYRRLVVQGG
jgi:ABC-2 type transport system permease protein